MKKIRRLEISSITWSFLITLTTPGRFKKPKKLLSSVIKTVSDRAVHFVRVTCAYLRDTAMRGQEVGRWYLTELMKCTAFLFFPSWILTKCSVYLFYNFLNHYTHSHSKPNIISFSYFWDFPPHSLPPLVQRNWRWIANIVPWHRNKFIHFILSSMFLTLLPPHHPIFTSVWVHTHPK